MIFARRAEYPRAIGGKALCWLGQLEEIENGLRKSEETALADASSDTFASEYADQARQGATIVPRILYFVDVQESAAALTPRIKKVSSQRSSQEKEPWKSLQPRELVNAPIEEEHIWNIYLGETVAPYVLLEPRKAVLPVRHGETLEEPKADDDTTCGMKTSAMNHRMRDRWKIISDLWDKTKTSNNKLSLVGRLNYQKGLSAQLDDYAPIRLLYATSGRPTAAVMHSPENFDSKDGEQLSTDSLSSVARISEGQKKIDESDTFHSFNAPLATLVDTSLYWVKCKTLEEAYYLAAIINSSTLEQAVQKFMPKGQFGARHLHKHLWRLPIPIYDNDNSLHANLSQLGNQLATEAATHLTNIRTTRASANKPTTINVARRELRKWLSTHPPAQQIEQLVDQIL